MTTGANTRNPENAGVCIDANANEFIVPVTGAAPSVPSTIVPGATFAHAFGISQPSNNNSRYQSATVSVTCTPNPPKATLTIIKNSVGANGTFDIGVAGPTVSTETLTTSGGTVTRILSVDPGAYTISETPPAGWALTGVNCVKGGVSSNAGVTLADGESATCTVTNTKQTAGLSITKTAQSPAPYTQVGQAVVFDIAVTNTGPATLTGVTVSDATAMTSGCSAAVLTGGQSLSCIATHIVTQTDLDTGSYINTADATATSPLDGVLRASASATVTGAVTGGLTLTETVAPETYSDVDQMLTYTIVATNAGNVAVRNFALANSNATLVSCAPVPVNGLLVPGQSTTCTATRVTTAADMTSATPCLADVATGTGTRSNGSVSTATATAKACLTNDKTKAAISQFINRRVDLLASNEPDRARIMRRLDGRGSSEGSSSVSVTGSSESGNADVTVATSLNQLRSANRAKSSAGGESGDETRMGLGSSLKDGVSEDPLALDIWLEAHVQRWSDDKTGVARKGDFGIAYLGADYLVTPGLLAGVLVQVDWTSDFNKSLTTEITGVGWMAGPYMSAKLSENLMFDARGAWGTSSNDITPFATYTDRFETERWLAKANLTGNWWFDNLRISPSVGVIYVEETQKAYVDSVGLTIPEQTAHVGRLTFGPEFGTKMELGEGNVLEPHVGFMGMWDFAKSGELQQNGLITTQDDLRMKIEAGATLHGESGGSIRATASYDGIGAKDFSAWGGQLWVNVPLESLGDDKLFTGLLPKCCEGNRYALGGEPVIIVAQATDAEVNAGSAAGASADTAPTAVAEGEEPAYELPTVVVPTGKEPPVAPAAPKSKPAPVAEDDEPAPAPKGKSKAKKSAPSGGAGGGSSGGSSGGAGMADAASAAAATGSSSEGADLDLSGRAGQRIVEKVASVTVVTAKDIEKSGARSLDEAIDLVPGLYVRNAADGVPRIDIRGLRTRNILLLLDGVPLNSTADGQFDPRSIPVENIAKIKVTRGASSVLYGPGGNAAVIDIVTKSAAAGLHGSVQAEYSPERGTQERATASYGSKKFQMFMSASGLDQDHFNLSNDFVPTKQQPGDERINSDRRDRALYSNMQWSPSEVAKFGLSVNYKTGEYGKPPATIVRNDPAALPESRFVPRTRFERVEDNENLSLQSSSWIRFNSRFSIRPLAYYNRLHEVTDNYDDATFSTQTKQTALHEDATTSIGGGGIQAIYGYNGNQLTLALDGRNESWTAKGFCIPGGGGGGGGGGGNCPGAGQVDYDERHDIQVFSAAAEQELLFAPGISAVFGAGYVEQRRAGNSDDDYTYLAGLRVDVADTTTLRGSVARKVRFPTLRDLFDFAGGNPDLQTEVTQNYEVGIEQEIPELKAFVSIALFQIDATNFIERQNQVFTNIGELRFRGIETTAHYRGIENLDLSAGYTFLSSENKSPDPGDTDKLQNRPAHKLTASASYRFDGGLTVNAEYLYIAGSYALSSGGGPVTALELDSYHVVNVGASQDIIATSAQLFGRIENLFDEDYAETLGFPQPGRAFYGGVRAKF